MINNSEKDFKFWKNSFEQVKSNLLARKAYLDTLSPENWRRLDEAHTAAGCLCEDFQYHFHLEYSFTVDLRENVVALTESLGWDDTDETDSDIRLILNACEPLFAAWTSMNARLSHKDVQGLETIYHALNRMLHVRPNKAQLSKFEEYGVTWEGETNDI